MARITLDIGAEEPGIGGSALIPVGTYDAIIDDVESTSPKQGDNMGKPMYRITFKLDGGEYNGRKANSSVCLWNGALISFFQLMTAIGKKVEPGKLDVPEPSELIGKKVAVKIKHDEYNGEATYKVGRILPRKGGGTGVTDAASAGTKRSGTKRVAFGS